MSAATCIHKQKDVVYQEKPFLNVKTRSNCDKTAAAASSKLIFSASLLPPVLPLCLSRTARTSCFVRSSQRGKLIGYGRPIKADWKHFLLEVRETNGRDFTFENAAIQLRCKITVGQTRALHADMRRAPSSPPTRTHSPQNVPPNELLWLTGWLQGNGDK